MNSCEIASLHFLFIECIELTMLFLAFLFLVFIPLLAIGIYFETRKWWLNFTKLKNYEQLNGLPVLGVGYRFFGKKNDEVLKTMDEIFHKTTKRPCATWLGTTLTFCVDDPDGMQAVLNSDQFLDKPYVYEHLHNRTGLLGSPKEIWKSHRKTLNPTFNYKVIQSFFPTLNSKAKILADQTGQKIGQNINLNCAIFKCLMDMILNTQLGMNWEMQSTRGDKLYEMFIQVMGFFQHRIVRFWLRWDFIYDLTTTGRQEKSVLTRGYRFLRSIGEIKALEFADKLDKGEDVLEESKQNNTLTWIQKCFLLLREGKFTEEHVIEEIDTLFVGGTDTTTVTLVSTIILLAIHQEYQEKVFEELREVYADPDDPVTYDDIPKLKFMEMVIKETTRLFPVGPLIARKCSEDFPYKDGIIPEGSLMVLNINKMHYDERYWGPNAKEFYPERFLPENFDKIHPFAYLAFSGGPRNCIGIKYAWCVTKMILVYLLRRYKFTTHLKYEDIQTKVCCILKMANKDPVCVERREWK